MAPASRKSELGRSTEFRGFLKNPKDWDYLSSEKDQKSSSRASQTSRANAANFDQSKAGAKSKASGASEISSKDQIEDYSYFKYADKNKNFSGFNSSGDSLPDAASEKELGNEYFKQKKYIEAIDCYSRSIVFSPTSVAFANRAMAYLKLKRFEEAESDCTEALNLDDRYVKAYLRRATARRELGKLKESLEDADFAVRIDPNNQEVRKQYSETKSLYEKDFAKNISESGSVKASGQVSRRSVSPVETKNIQADNLLRNDHQIAAPNSFKAGPMKSEVIERKNESKASLQDLASRAASRVTETASKNIMPPKSAYEFEVSWRALSNDCALQAKLLKMTPPSTLPQIFKNALSAPILVDIIKCISTLIKEDTEIGVSILDNMTRVPRFDMIIMCLAANDRAEVQRIWAEVFLSEDIPLNYREQLSHLQPKYCTRE